MKYITVSIGNTDNKLSQQEWHDFVEEVGKAIKFNSNIHFFGGSSNWEPWQNVTWVFEIQEDEWIERTLQKVRLIRMDYNQDSAFVLIGDGQFI